MGIIDVETLRLGDPAEDFGYLVAEIKHIFWSYTEDPWRAEPFIQFTHTIYASSAKLDAIGLTALTARGRYFMSCVEFHIARNYGCPLTIEEGLWRTRNDA